MKYAVGDVCTFASSNRAESQNHCLIIQKYDNEHYSTIPLFTKDQIQNVFGLFPIRIESLNLEAFIPPVSLRIVPAEYLFQKVGNISLEAVEKIKLFVKESTELRIETKLPSVKEFTVEHCFEMDE